MNWNGLQRVRERRVNYDRRENRRRRNERKEETKEKISSISKNVLDVCYSYLTEDAHEKDIPEIIKDKVAEMTVNGQIDGDAVTKLYDLYKTYTASAEDVTDISEENVATEASDSDTEETN